MKISARLLALALIAAPAVPVLSATTATAAPAGPVTVARYTFDAGVAPGGRVAENSGRGVALTVRAADKGTVRFLKGPAGQYAAFPARCATAAKVCARALLEGADDPDLDPGVRRFTWGASVLVAKTQLAGSPNVVQKGVVTTESQWKLQIGQTHGKAQCVVVGRGNAKPYLARATVNVADSKWHKVRCERSGAALSVYVDGVLKGRTAIPAALSILNDKPLRIGGPNFNTTKDMYHGSVDDVFAQLG